MIALAAVKSFADAHAAVDVPAPVQFAHVYRQVFIDRAAVAAGDLLRQCAVLADYFDCHVTDPRQMKQGRRRVSPSLRRSGR